MMTPFVAFTFQNINSFPLFTTAVLPRIAILAPGLLGASLAKALRKRCADTHVSIWARRAAIRHDCLAAGLADSVHEQPAAAVEEADLVVLCAPVAKLPALAAACAPGLRPGAVVTDVGSTKAHVCRDCAAVLPEHAVFIGSHPMAGSEKSGMDYADADLFQGRVCIVTPAQQPQTVIETVVRFWQCVGMQVVTLSPEEHDSAVAHVSHLPHFIASALAAHLHTAHPQWAALSGNGLRDTTRIAAGSPALWREIFQQNREEVLLALANFNRQLTAMQDALQNNDFSTLEHWLTVGKQFRDKLPPVNRSESS